MNLRIISRPIPLFILLLITLMLVLPSAQAPVKAASPVYMRPDGDDWQCNGLVDAPYPGGTGPLPCAFQTFWKAHSEVDDPGIIYVGAGVYPDVFSIGKSVTVIGAGVDQTIIDRGGDPQGIIISGGVPPIVVISNLTVRNSINIGSGGGIVIANGTITLRDCAIENNTASSGGGIENWGTLTLERCTISGNVATGSFGGGGIINRGTLKLIDSSVVNNHADTPSASGGGIQNRNGVSDHLYLIRTTLSGNSADLSGSALGDGGDGHTWLANVTITGNTIASGYGTVVVTAGHAVDIWNSTIAENHAGGPGTMGGILTGSPVILANTILSDNDFSNCSVTGAGVITTTGANIDSGSTCGFTTGPDMPNTDPLLGPLADNGGYSETMALLPGSLAIDAGYGLVCSMFPVDGVDQRGWSRPIDGDLDGTPTCDIGAYEKTIDLFLPLIMR